MSAVKDITNDIRKTGNASFEVIYPGVTGTNHFYQKGLVTANDFTYNLSDYYGIRLRLSLKQASKIKVTLDIVKNRTPKDEKHVWVNQILSVASGEHRVIMIPIQRFSLSASECYHLQFVRGFQVEGDHNFVLEECCLVKGKAFGVSCDCSSKAAQKGERINYELVLSNCRASEQTVILTEKKYGWQELEADYPTEVVLKPYEEKKVIVSLTMSGKICEGGREEQTLFLMSDAGDGEMESITFTSLRALAHPFVLVDEQEIQNVKDKITRCQWAKETYAYWYSLTETWQAPLMDGGDHLFHSNEGDHVRIASIIYKVSNEKRFGLEVVKFLKGMSDPVSGYFRTYHAGHQEMVHEGEIFKNVAIAYDMVYEMEELTVENHHNMETMFRSAIHMFDMELKKGEISNWTLAEASGGLYMACVLQDFNWMKRFLYGIGGAAEHLSRGTFSDGWWFEASIGYNLLCAGFFSEIAQVVRHFGMDFKDVQVPASYSKSVNTTESLKDGLVFENWGENNKNYRNISMLWDSLIPYADYRGIVFGINDSIEMKLVGITPNLSCPRYDLAYYLYRKPEYARIIKRLEPKERDLLFGAEYLEETAGGEDAAKRSCYSDNAGAAVLRSQKPGREEREQIQVGLKYGSHGGAHGHYDRVSMTSLMRYGRSLTNPENIWYSYHTFMYKFYVQNSINHNMVTVDLKLQDPREPRRLLFHSGERMQAIALENESRWSNPPYGGWQVNGDKTLMERSWKEGRFIPIPDNPPEYAVRTEFTEPVLTRRLTVLTDDFVVNFDYARGTDPHNYDCIYHLHGLYETQGLDLQKHTEKLDESPLSSGQFITDCNWYKMETDAKLRFKLEYGESKNNGNLWMCRNRTGHNEPGVLKTDLYIAYPPDTQVIVGCDPEYQGVNKQLFYEVLGDEETLAKGQFGAWVLGKEKIDVDLSLKKELVLKVKVNQVEFEKDIYIPMEKSIFWGNPCIETNSGKRISLSQLDLKYENTDLGNGVGIDYANGPVKIQGELFDQALPAEPRDSSGYGYIRINLAGMDARRFTASIGSDYPVGDESERRKTVAIRNVGRQARFITVLEPVENTHLIKKVEAINENHVVVYFEEKRVDVTISGLDTEKPSIQMKVWEGETIVAEENA